MITWQPHPATPSLLFLLQLSPLCPHPVGARAEGGPRHVWNRCMSALLFCSSCPVFKRREVESGLHVCPFCCDGVVGASFAVCRASCEMFLLGVLEKGHLNGDGKPIGAAWIWTLALCLTWSLSLWSLQTLSPPTSWWTRAARSNCATLVWVASSSTPWPTPSLEHGRTCRWVTRPLPSPIPLSFSFQSLCQVPRILPCGEEVVAARF